MIMGIGIDVIKIARITALYDRYGDRFARRILSQKELKELPYKINPHHFLAKRFAVKEALVKALGTGFREGIVMPDITLEHDAMGRPSVVFSGFLEQLCIAKQISGVHVSLSDEKDYAVAMAVLEG